MEATLQKQLEERCIFKESLLDGRIKLWVAKEGKINYDELYRIMIKMNKTLLNESKG